MIIAAFSPTIIAVEYVFPPTLEGQIERSEDGNEFEEESIRESFSNQV